MFVKRLFLLASLAACNSTPDVPDGGPTSDACTTVCTADSATSCPDLTKSCCGVTCGDASAWGCLFGSCSEQLQPTKAAAGSIAADQRNVYWATGTDVFKASLDGGSAVSIATGQGGPSDLVVGGQTLYWTTASGDLVAARIDDAGAPFVIANGSSGVASRARHQVAADDNYVYWIHASGDAGTNVLMTNASDGGAPAPFAPKERPSAIEADETSLFICSDGIVEKLDKLTAQAEQLGQGCTSEIAVGPTSVYWSNDTQTIVSAAKDGSGGGTIRIPDVGAGVTLDHISNLLVADTTLFWINHVTAAGFNLGSASILSSVQGDAGAVNLTLGPADLASNSTSLFWTSESGFLIGGGDIQSVTTP